MAYGGEVHAYLVGAPGLQIDADQGGRAEALQHIPVGDGLLAGRRDREAEVRDPGPSDGGLDGGLVLGKIALNQGVVDLDHLMPGELPTHLLVGQVGLADQHEAAGARVQAGDDALTALGPHGGDVGAPLQEAAQNGWSGPAYGGMCRHPNRLVNDDHVLVLVDHGHVLSHRLHLCGRLGLVQLYQIAAHQGGGLVHPTAHDPHMTLGHQIAGLGPGQAQHLGQGHIQAPTHQGIRRGKKPGHLAAPPCSLGSDLSLNCTLQAMSATTATPAKVR